MKWTKHDRVLHFSTDNGLEGQAELIEDSIIHFRYTRQSAAFIDSEETGMGHSELISDSVTAKPFPEVIIADGNRICFETPALRVEINASEGIAAFYKKAAEDGSDEMKAGLCMKAGSDDMNAGLCMKAGSDDMKAGLCMKAGSDDMNSGLLMREGAKELSQIDVFNYTTGGEKPVVERVKTVDGERNFIKNLKCEKDHKAYRAKYGFDFQADEGIYGFGQGEEGVYNHRHQNDYLYQHNMRIPMPTFYSDRGYGMLFDCGSLMTFEDDAAGSYLFMDTVSSLDYYFVAGENPDKVINGFRMLTGRAAMLPQWTFGYIQSKEQYYSADELCDVVKHYRDLEIPLDCVVQDWNSWKPGQWGEKKLDPSRYGNIEEKMHEIHDMHAHAMISVWPNMNSTTDDYAELSGKGMILNDLSTYNAFDAKARAVYWKQAKEGLFDKGFDSWWCDSTEPFSGPDWNGEMKREPWERFQMVGNEHRKYLPPEKANLYALEHARGIFENQTDATKSKRVLNLTRSGYISGQKYGALLWSGDISATWDTMRKQITEGLSMGLSGYPYWTLDIGGFFVLKKNWQKRGCTCNMDSSMKWFWNGEFENGIKDYAYREFYVRFLEFGAFLPVFRSHGTDTPREIWNFGEKGDIFYDSIAKFIRLRYRLLPYIYSLAGAVRLENETMMRSLLFDFAADECAKKIENEFMLGRSLLVCPVTKQMYYDPAPENNEAEGPFEIKKVNPDEYGSCYLPKGCKWYDFWTNECYDGGQTIAAYAPLDRIPVFVKAGSIIPMKEKMQYAGDRVKSPVDIHIYPGCDGEFTLYEDEGDGYGYEKGEFSLIKLFWSQKEQSLFIGNRRGHYHEMQEERVFRILVENEGIEEAVPDAADADHKARKEILYNGEEISISI